MRGLDGLPPEVLLVPLPGHTLGHAGVAFDADGRWHLQAGDAYFHRDEMDPVAPRCTPGLRLYQALMEKDRAARLANQRRLREAARDHAGRLRVLCSHDPVAFEAVAGRGSASLPERVVAGATAGA